MKLVVPAIDWCLQIVVVSQECFDKIYNDRNSEEKHLVKLNDREMLFVQEDMAFTERNGVPVSSWVLGDPQVSRTRVSYEYVNQYRKTYGSGFGSRRRISCLDSVNWYRDKRFNARVHPSPLIHDDDIGKHQ